MLAKLWRGVRNVRQGKKPVDKAEVPVLVHDPRGGRGRPLAGGGVAAPPGAGGAGLFAAVFASYEVLDLAAIPFGSLWRARRGIH